MRKERDAGPSTKENDGAPQAPIRRAVKVAATVSTLPPRKMGVASSEEAPMRGAAKPVSEPVTGEFLFPYLFKKRKQN